MNNLGTSTNCDKDFCPRESEDYKINNCPLVYNSVQYDYRPEQGVEAKAESEQPKNFTVAYVMATFREPKCFYINIFILFITLGVFCAVLFGFVPFTAQYQNLKYQLNATQTDIGQCTAMQEKLQTAAEQLDSHLTECSKELQTAQFNVNKTQQELDISKSNGKFMDDRITQLKDQVADLVSHMRLKDQRVQELEDLLQEKSAQASPIVFNQANHVIHTTSVTLCLSLLSLCVLLK